MSDEMVMHKVIRRVLLDPPFDTVTKFGGRRIRIKEVEITEEDGHPRYVRPLGNPLSKNGVVVGSFDMRYVSDEDMTVLTERALLAAGAASVARNDT